jgi:predicted ferric reductase
VTAPDLRVSQRPVASPRRGIAPEELLAAIVVGAIAVAVWPVALVLSGPAPLPLSAALAHVTGMLAGYGVVVLLALMARAPALERGVGADRLARWHGRGGRIVVTLVLVHAVTAVTAWAGAQGVDPASAAWQVLTMPGLIAATAGTGLLLAVAALSVRAARKRVSYEQWHAVHLLVYAGVALSFTHQLAGPDLAGRRVLQVLWALLYTGVFALVLQHRVIAPLRNAGRHRLRVSAVVPEGPDVVSVIIAGEHLHELRAESGQFFRWRFLTPDLWRTAHPFSLSAAPTPTHLRLTVKALGDSSTTLQILEPGTWVLAEGPYGAITAERRTRRDVLLVAGGVGITPMRALFETMPLGPGQDLMLIYRARSVDDLLFRAELEAIARTRGARLQYLLGNQIGPFTADLFHRLVPGLPHRDVYLCGPPAMATAARRALRDAGLPAVQLHEERFDF